MSFRPRRLQNLATIGCGRVEVPVAEGFVARLLGLALLDRSDAGAGLLIPRCGSVHTFGMRFRLDLAFLDASGYPFRVVRSVPAGRMVAAPGAVAVLEVPSGGLPEVLLALSRAISSRGR